MKLEDLINGSDMNQLQKNSSLGFISRAKESENQTALEILEEQGIDYKDFESDTY